MSLDLNLDAVRDSDYVNVAQDIRDVVHHSAATPVRPKKGVRCANRGEELQKAKNNLKEDMRHLLNSPHVQGQMRVKQALKLDSNAICALRSLWTFLEKMRKVDTESAGSEEAEAALKDAVQKAVTALNPSRTFPEEEEEMEMNDNASAQALRKSQRLASKAKKNYDELKEDNELAELIGDQLDGHEE